MNWNIRRSENTLLHKVLEHIYIHFVFVFWFHLIYTTLLSLKIVIIFIKKSDKGDIEEETVSFILKYQNISFHYKQIYDILKRK